ncbi:hypothetical protein ACQBAU_05030 [Propionibacteriaceae bacterium Y2011]
MSFGPSREPLTVEEAGLVPGVTDKAAELGRLSGVGRDEDQTVTVEVNGVMGVSVRLTPALITVGSEQAGHLLAAALEDARRQVVAAVTERLAADATLAPLLDTRPATDEHGIGHEQAPRPRQGDVVSTSPDGLVTVVVGTEGEVTSVVVRADEVVLEELGLAFVVAAEAALQGGDGDDVDADARLGAFDKAMERIDRRLNNLDSQLSALLKD